MGAGEGSRFRDPPSPPYDPALGLNFVDPYFDWRVPFLPHFCILFFSFWSPWFEVVLVWAQAPEY
jgi:hypothetical protein